MTTLTQLPKPEQIHYGPGPHDVRRTDNAAPEEVYLKSHEVVLVFRDGGRAEQFAKRFAEYAFDLDPRATMVRYRANFDSDWQGPFAYVLRTANGQHKLRKQDGTEFFIGAGYEVEEVQP